MSSSLPHSLRIRCQSRGPFRMNGNHSQSSHTAALDILLFASLRLSRYARRLIDRFSRRSCAALSAWKREVTAELSSLHSKSSPIVKVDQDGGKRVSFSTDFFSERSREAQPKRKLERKHKRKFMRFFVGTYSHLGFSIAALLAVMESEIIIAAGSEEPRTGNPFSIYATPASVGLAR